MVARTHSQHALPITFGFKVAIWVDDLGHHEQRLAEVKRRLLVGKVTGVVGSQAAYGEQGLELQRRVCAKLGLFEPDTSIQTSRSRFQEFIFVLTLIGNTLQQIAKEVWTRQRPELDELHERFAEGEQVGSTTLAFKRNPTRCEWLLGYGKILRGHLVSVTEMVMEDERDGARIAGEYALIPDTCLVAGCAVRLAQELVSGLEVNVERMRENLDVTRGFVFSEAVMMALASAGLGKQLAHEVLYECANRCYRERIPLKQSIQEHAAVRNYLNRIDLDQVMRPENYLGTIPTQIDAALARFHAAAPGPQLGAPHA
jgi:adenylosuccinate lyase